jgi:hypothetical protein
MIAKLVPVALALAVMSGCATSGGSDSPGSPLVVDVSKNQSFVKPLDDAKIGGGFLLRVDFKVASGRIFSVDYTCSGGDVCAHVFECPAGGRCGSDHPDRVTFDGNLATWWGWTDTGMVTDARLKFDVHYTDADPTPPPC